MFPLNRNELENLIMHREPLCLSLLIPGRRMGLEKLQARVRFKNLLQQAQEELLAMGVKKQEFQPWVFPLMEWLRDDDFWEHQQDGVAFYASPSQLRVFNLPIALEEQAVVAERFYVKPLLELLERAGQFAVLALSQKQVRFFLDDHFSIQPAPLPNAPSGFSEIISVYAAQRQQYFHAEASPGAGGGRRPPIYYGRGLGTDPIQMKTHLFEYSRAVDQAVVGELKTRGIPLVLAAVEPLQTIYREANTYERLLPQGLDTGNPDLMTPLELHRGALDIDRIASDRSRRQQASKRWTELGGTGRALNDLPSVLQAAFSRQIDTLFVSKQDHVWGRYQPENAAPEIHPERRPGDDDLLDLAAVQAHLAEGTVYPALRSEIPGNGSVAAILRYAFAAAA